MELGQGVDDALGMDHHVHLGHGQAVKPAGLDDLQALVHEGGGIHADFRAHGPVGMGQGHGRGDGFQAGPVGAPERAARGGQHQLFDERQIGQAHAAQGLEQGVVFGVHGQDHRARGGGGGPDEVAGQDQGFLVGQGHDLAGGHGGQGRPKAGRAHDGRDHEVDLRGAGQGGVAGRADEDVRAVAGRQQLGQGGGPGVVDDGQHGRPEGGGLLSQKLHVGRAGQGHDVVFPGMLGRDPKGADANGAGGPKQGQTPGPAGIAGGQGGNIALAGAGTGTSRVGGGNRGHASRRAFAGSAAPGGAMP